jgi:hypothetical protein
MSNLIQEILILVAGAVVYWLIEFVRNKIWSDNRPGEQGFDYKHSEADRRELKQSMRELQSLDIDERLRALEEYVRLERRRRYQSGDPGAFS